MTACPRFVAVVGCLALAGCGGETAEPVGLDGGGPDAPEADTAREPANGGRARVLEQALIDRSRHPRVSAARCSDGVHGGARGPFGPEGRGRDIVVRCTLENRGATGVYSVQVLENGCFVAALRRSIGQADGAAPVQAIHACGDPDLLERLEE